jgi:hypothetical protein
MTPEQKRRKAKDYHLRINYGITLEEYELLFLYQDGHCALCPAVPTIRALAVDHDHDTGEIRSLLCLRCNKFIVGNQTIQNVRMVLSYLENPPAKLFFGGHRYVPKGKEKPVRRRKKRRTVKRTGTRISRGGISP